MPHGDVIVAPDGNLYRLCGRETISRRILAELLDRWDTSESGVRLGKGYRKVAWQEDALQRVGAFGLVHWTATEEPDVVRAGLGHPLPLADMPPGNRKQHRHKQYNGHHPNFARRECEMLEGLTWESAVWEPEPGKAIPYQWADITSKFYLLELDGWQIRLCRWRQTYSITVNEGDDLKIGVKQIPIADFDANPEGYFKAAQDIFVKSLPHRASNHRVLEQFLDDVFEKHHGDDQDFEPHGWLRDDFGQW